MKPKYYCLVMVDGLEPVLHGPYGSENALARRAKAIHNKVKDEDNLIGMVFNEKGIPEVWAYSGGFFEEE